MSFDGIVDYFLTRGGLDAPTSRVAPLPDKEKIPNKKATFDADSIHINLVVSESQSFEVGASNPRKKPKNQGLHRSAEKCTKRGFFAPPRGKMHRTLGFYQYLLLNTNLALGSNSRSLFLCFLRLKF
jgi:hypothetical protein